MFGYGSGYGDRGSPSNIDRQPVWQWTKVSEPQVVSAIPALLAFVKTFINRPLEDTFWDAETEQLITVAQAAIETYLQMSIEPATWLGTAPRLTHGTVIAKRPFLDVVGIQYVDPISGVSTTLDPSTYLVEDYAQRRGLIRLAATAQWPCAAQRRDAWRVMVTTGWPLDSDSNPIIPPDLMHALAMTVAALDASRGDGGGGGHLDNTVWGQTHAGGASVIPAGARALLASYRLVQTYF